MKIYMEFDLQEYYALITLNIEAGEDFLRKGAELYVEQVGGESVEEILEEGYPRLVTEEYAFWKLANCKDSESETVGNLLKEFRSVENGVVIIDSTLV